MASKKNRSTEARYDAAKEALEEATSEHDAIFVPVHDVGMSAIERRLGPECDKAIAKAKLEQARYDFEVAALEFAIENHEADAAAGHAGALCCSPKHLLSKLEAELNELQRVEAEVESRRQAFRRDYQNAQAAHDAYAAELTARDLPPPPRLPFVPPVTAPLGYVQALRKAAEDGPPLPSRSKLLAALGAADIARGALKARADAAEAAIDRQQRWEENQERTFNS